MPHLYIKVIKNSMIGNKIVANSMALGKSTQAGSILLATLFLLMIFLLIITMSITITDNQLSRAFQTKVRVQEKLALDAKLLDFKADFIAGNILIPFLPLSCDIFDESSVSLDLWSKNNDMLIYIKSCQSNPIWNIGHQTSLLNPMRTIYLGVKKNDDILWHQFNESQTLVPSEAFGIPNFQEILKNYSIDLPDDYVMSMIKPHDLSSNSAQFIVGFNQPLDPTLRECELKCDQLNLILIDQNGTLLKHNKNNKINNMNNIKMFSISQHQVIMMDGIGDIYLADFQGINHDINHNMDIDGDFGFRLIFSLNLTQKTHINVHWFYSDLPVLTSLEREIGAHVVKLQNVMNPRLIFSTFDSNSSRLFSLKLNLEEQVLNPHMQSDITHIYPAQSKPFKGMLTQEVHYVEKLKESWVLNFEPSISSSIQKLHNIIPFGNLILTHVKGNGKSVTDQNWIYAINADGTLWFNDLNIVGFLIDSDQFYWEYYISHSATFLDDLQAKCQIPNLSLILNKKYLIGCSTYKKYITQ